MSVEGATRKSRSSSRDDGQGFAGFRIERELGRGGMGTVYLAHQVDLDRPVALKLIREDLADDERFRERFRRESRTAAAIDHPGVVTVFGAGERDGLLYVAMRYVPGPDLQRLIAAEGALPPEKAATLVSDVGQGLDAVHEAGLVHRDVKPANVLVSEDPMAGRPTAQLTDFGLARSVASTTGITQTGELIGSVDYMAPEQIEGRRVDARTDVYALGCVLFQAMTGRVPFEDSEVSAKMWAHLNTPPPSAGPHPRAAALDAVIRRAMAKDPDQRYPSAGDLGRAAVAAAHGEAVTQPEHPVGAGEAAVTESLPASTVTRTPTTAPQPRRRRPRRRRRRRWAALLLAVLVLAGLAAVTAVEAPKLIDTTTSRPAAPSGVAVPDLIGVPLDVAEQRLDELGLRSDRVGGGLFGVVVPSDWEVCQTSPAPGSSARAGSTVRLLVDRPDVC